MKNKTTVIIPNYNGMKFLPKCFDALERQVDACFGVVVVDNASSDESIGWLEKKKSELCLSETSVSGMEIIKLSDNTGFSAAVNRGIKAANTPYVLLLNNDAYPEPDFVDRLERAMEADDRIFAVGSRMIMDSKRTHLDGACDGLTVMGWAYQRGIDEPIERFSKSSSVFSACAGAALYRRDVFEKTGYFDELHFAYLEDIDMCYRAKIAGYRNFYCADAKVYHVGSGTSGSKYNSFKVRLAARNNIYLQYKNQPLPQLIINAVPLILGIAIKGIFFKKIGYPQDYIDGLKEGIRTAKNCKKAGPAKHGIFTYVWLELELIAYTFEYIICFVRRQIGKSKRS